MVSQLAKLLSGSTQESSQDCLSYLEDLAKRGSKLHDLSPLELYRALKVVSEFRQVVWDQLAQRPPWAVMSPEERARLKETHTRLRKEA